MADLTIHELQNEATTPAANDYMVLDGATAGTRKITPANLATWVLGKISSLATTVTSFASGDFIAVSNTTDGTRKMATSKLMELTAQNALAGNVAPAFDPTKPNDAGGYAYYADEIVAYNGATYKFKVNHSSGAWNSSEVDRYDAGEILKFFLVTDNPEYLYAITDKDGMFLFGIKSDGSVEWAKGVPTEIKSYVDRVRNLLDLKVDKEIGKSLIDSVFAEGVSIISNQEYMFAILDADDKFLFGIDGNGSVEWAGDVPQKIKDAFAEVYKVLENELSTKVDKEIGKSLIDAIVALALSGSTSQEAMQINKDSNDKVLSYVDKDGRKHFATAPVFEKGVEIPGEALNSLFEQMNKARSMGDYTEAPSAEIPEPRCAVVNIYGTNFIPMAKGSDIKCWMEFYDGVGNYFKKKIILDAQGNSTLDYPKHNAAIDICNDAWEGDDTFKVKFGDWPAQDSFHIKAFWVDPFSGAISCGLYDLLDDIWKDRGFTNDAPWKKALVPQGSEHGYEMHAITDYNLRIDTGARNHPLAFPCVLYLNGKFHGLYAFSLKKHRDVYHQKKSDTKQIHLDGEMGNFWRGTIDWTKFEVRNPKDLICMDGTKYDGDNPLELIDSTSPVYDASNKKMKNTKTVKEYVVAASQIMTDLDAIVSQYGIDSEEFTEAYESHFDLDNIIDYIIFSEITLNTDSGTNNVQWVTYDGVKWWACPYDLDRCCGNWYGYFNRNISGHFAVSNAVPTKYITQNAEYLAALQQRYSELRQKGIISLENYFKHIHNWVMRAGFDNVSKDWDRWPEKPCNMDTVIDSEHWEMVLVDGKPVYGTYDYDNDHAYSVDDECYYGYKWSSGLSTLNDHVKFKCVSPSTGNPPCTSIRSRDSEWRIHAFITAQIERMDTLYNYNQGA